MVVAELQPAFLQRLTVDEVELVLVDEQWRVMLPKILFGNGEGLKRLTGDADVECLALAHDVYESLKCLFEWRVRVVAVAVEEIHII